MDCTTYRHLTRLCCVFFCFNLLLTGSSASQTLFTDVTETVNIQLHNTLNLTFGDYDNDGLPDLLLTDFAYRAALLHNEGDGRFLDRPVLPVDPQKRIQLGRIFGDYDNDGDRDIYLPAGAVEDLSAGAVDRPIRRDLDVLLRNDGGVFRDVTRKAGLTDSLFSSSAIWLDYNRDGYLDLYVGHGDFLEPVLNKLHRNNGDGTFADVTEEAGLDIPLHPFFGGATLGMVAGDFNDDGWPDLYLGVIFASNHLFLNDGQGGFQDAIAGDLSSPAGVPIGVAVGDIDNDGDLDIFQANVDRFSFITSPLPSRSAMLMNLGDGQFLDVTDSVGLAGLFGLEVAGPALTDIDNDGDLDLLLDSPCVLFLNNGDGTFVDQTSQSGFAGYPGFSASFGDYDLDGFQDLFLGGNPGLGTMESAKGRLYRNRGNDNHYLRVELVGIESNRSGIGARLIATSGDRQQMREILGGRGLDQDGLVVHFGLGSHTQVDQLEIRWPSGQVDQLRAIPSDQQIRVFEGRKAYYVVRPAVWKNDIPDSLVVGSTIALTATVHPALLETAAEVIKVTADLSDLGGPASVPLTDRGDGTYALKSTEAVEGPNGVRILSILIEQATSLGRYWSNLSKTILVLPEDQVIFADALAHDWDLELSGEVEVNPQTTTKVYQGQFALALKANTYKVRCLPTHPLIPVGYETLRFVFHPGDATMILEESSASDPVNKIAFHTMRDGNREVYVMEADGTNPVNLTNNPAEDSRPAWSPDGTKIAFESDRDGNREVYVMAADGTNPVNLTNNPAEDGWPAWSPDGTKIAFESYSDGNREVYVMAADGTNPVNLTNNPARDGDPAWSPDGAKIVFESYRDGNREVYVMAADGTNPVNLTNNPARDGDPAWSPDGTKIAFASYHGSDGHWEVHVMAADGTNPARLTNHPESDSWPAWVESTSGVMGLRDAITVSINNNVVRLLDGDLESICVNMDLKEWQVVEIPLGAFDIIGSIEEIRFWGNLRGSFYLDDIRLVAAKPSQPVTAMLEQHTAAVPRTFTLEQNYPNPFNSGTVIRFTLPASEETELAIYNLMGQKVVTLVKGAWESGVYNVRWDSRDERGHTLASGVYLYQLRVGVRGKTRKLLLLR